MSKTSLKPIVRQFYRSILEPTRIELDRLNRSAIVFAPHPDDETLGCGGTIIRKKQAGANVKIVWMTDGSASHAHLISPQELKEIRAREALLATEKLGLEKCDVTFLEFKDGTLSQNAAIATEKVKQILLEYLPEEIFVPYAKDGIPDHNATNQIIFAALKKCGLNVTVYEYPVWFWSHWPWTECTGKGKQLFSTINRNFNSGFKLFKEFRYSVDVSQTLEQKRAALEQHQSQIKQLFSNPEWRTLEDVSGGEFLNCFFQRKEFFRMHKVQEKTSLFNSY